MMWKDIDIYYAMCHGLVEVHSIAMELLKIMPWKISFLGRKSYAIRMFCKHRTYIVPTLSTLKTICAWQFAHRIQKRYNSIS